jgi:hypothetical protein
MERTLNHLVKLKKVYIQFQNFMQNIKHFLDFYYLNLQDLFFQHYLLQLLFIISTNRNSHKQYLFINTNQDFKIHFSFYSKKLLSLLANLIIIKDKIKYSI